MRNEESRSDCVQTVETGNLKKKHDREGPVQIRQCFHEPMPLTDG